MRNHAWPALLSAATLAAAAAPPVTENEGWPVRWKWGVSALVADLDGDGWSEVVAGSFDWSEPELQAWDHRGRPLAGWPIPLPLGTAQVLGAADLDNDGEVEVLAHVWHTTTERAYLCAFRHDGSQPPGWPVSLHRSGGRAPTVADLDGDGRLETVVAAHPRWGGPSNIEAYDASGRELAWSPFEVPHTIESSPAIGDLDLDGDLDIVFAAYDRPRFGSGWIYALDWDGAAGADSEPLARIDTPVSTAPLSVVDLAGGPRPELVLSDDLGRIHLLDHRGRALPPWPTERGGFRAEMPVALGFHRGRASALWCAGDDHRVALFDAAGRTLPGWPWRGSWLIRSQILVADLDGDPEQEAFVGGSNPHLWALEQDGSPVAGWPVHTGSNDFGTGQLADLDRDGDTDIVFQGYDGKIHVFDTPGLYRPSRITCPAYQYDRRHTGTYEKDLYREAESANRRSGWSALPDTGAWGRQILTPAAGDGRTPPLLYRIETPELGRYTLWLRLRRPSVPLAGPLPMVRIDRQTLGGGGERASSPGGWTWYRAGVSPLEAGVHQIEIDARANDLQIDRLLLTSREAFPMVRERPHGWEGSITSEAPAHPDSAGASNRS